MSIFFLPSETIEKRYEFKKSNLSTLFHTCGLYPRMASNYMCFPQNQRKASELENKKRKCTDWQRDAALIKIRENRRRKKKKKKEIIETRKKRQDQLLSSGMKTSPQAKRHKPSLLFTSLTILTFITRYYLVDNFHHYITFITR